MDISAILNELGEDRHSFFGAVSPPIFQTSNFCFPNVAALRSSLEKEKEVPFYTRGNNPTVELLRKKIAALEGGEDALMFGSGSAAVAAAIMHVVQAGDHVVCVQKPYSWTNKLLNQMLNRYGVETTMVDGTLVENWKEAIKPNTKLFVLESPNSLTFELQDLAAVSALAKAHGITTVCDNSYATPLNQQPIKLGVDIVVHSATKYLAGHSDVVVGALISTKERCDKIFHSEFMTLGGILAPFEAWLVLRGLRTLSLRVERAASSGMKVVDFLSKHSKIERILHPHHPSFPQYQLALKQQKRPGGMFSIFLKAENISAVERFCDSLRYFLIAASWGGYESLQYPICTLYDSENYGYTQLPWNMVRLYVGIEEPDDLIFDLNQALEKV